MLDVSVVIVNFNTKKLTLGCINSVFAEGSKLKKEVIVIDNGSTDGSVEALRKLGDKIVLIENSENLGFAKANNQGIKAAKGKFVMLVNSDAVIANGAIDKLVDFARVSQNAGAVVPKLLHKDGSAQASVFHFPTLTRAVQQYWLGMGKPLNKYVPHRNGACEVEAAVMAAFLITPRALKKVGLLDERYFMFFEDIDYCKRINKSGLKVYYLPQAEVVHYHGESGKSLADEQNQWRRLVPSSKIYHGLLGHYLFSFVLWSGQKWQRLIGKK